MSRSSQADWLRVAGNPEHWLTVAEGLRHSAHAVNACASQLWMGHMCVLPAKEDDPNTIILPTIDLDWLMQRGPLALGHGPLMVVAVNAAFYLLAGYSFENLIKGVLIGREPPEHIPTLVASWAGKKGHNLVWLADKVQLPLTCRDRGLLNILTRYTTHMGRYPTPLKATGLQSVKHDSDECNLLEEIWNMLMAEFEKVRERRRPQTPPSPQEGLAS